MSSVVSKRKTTTTRLPRARKKNGHRPDQDLVLMLIMDFPAPLKKKLARQAKEADTNITRYVVTALAEEFKVKYVPSSRGWSGIGESDRLSLSMPYKLRTKIANASRDQKTTMREVVINTLSQRLK